MYSGYDGADLFVFGQKTAITKSTVTKTVCVSLIQIIYMFMYKETIMTIGREVKHHVCRTIASRYHK